MSERVYFISVNPLLKQKLQKLPNWVDISPRVDMNKYYQTMGIDRIMVCEAINDGVIIDAGSAITVDVMEQGKFMGGYIYPGIEAMSRAYRGISELLAYSFNFEIDLDKMPKNSEDAISYGFLKTLYSEVLSHKKQIYLCGGDAKVFAKIFKDAIVDEDLVFKGMRKFIKGEVC
jgi:type III pantothenate kinase